MGGYPSFHFSRVGVGWVPTWLSTKAQCRDMGKRLTPTMISILLVLVALPIVFNSAQTGNVVSNDLNNPEEVYDNCDTLAPESDEDETAEFCRDRLHRTEHAFNGGWTLLGHMVGGSLLMFSAPITFNSNVLKKRKGLHRKAGYAFILGGVITGISALSMTIIFPNRFSAFNVFTNLLWGTLLVGSPLMALRAILAGRVKSHRAWMIRCYAVAAGPSGHRWLFFVVDIIGDFGVSLLIFLIGEMIIRRVGLKTLRTMMSIDKGVSGQNLDNPSTK